jgi:hypothetical protein
MRWLRRLETLGAVRISWRVFSLMVVNQRGDGAVDPLAGSGLALRTAVAVRDRHGNDAMGAFFAALGDSVHLERRAADRLETVEEALRVAGLDPAIAAGAAADPATWEAVLAEHGRVAERNHAFGVPTIVLDGGEGPEVFGPVISDLPQDDAEAVELWRHVSWLMRNPSFFELKRARERRPNLGAVPGVSGRPAAASR